MDLGERADLEWAQPRLVHNLAIRTKVEYADAPVLTALVIDHIESMRYKKWKDNGACTGHSHCAKIGRFEVIVHRQIVWCEELRVLVDCGRV